MAKSRERYLAGVYVLGALPRGSVVVAPLKPAAARAAAAPMALHATPTLSSAAFAAARAALRPPLSVASAVAAALRTGGLAITPPKTPAIATKAATPLSTTPKTAAATAAAQATKPIDPSLAARANASANKLMAAGKRLSAKRKGKGLGAAAVSAAQKSLDRVKQAQSAAAHRVMGHVVGATAPWTVAFDPTTFFSTQAGIDDAMSGMADAGGRALDLIDQLTTAGQTDLASQGQAIVDRMQTLLDTYNGGSTDQSLGAQAFATIQKENSWEYAVNQATGKSPSGSGGSGTPAGAPTISAVNDVTNPAGNTPPQPSPYGGMMTGGANPGDQVAITGTNLTGASSVTFGGVPASFNVVSATQITAAVPAGAQSGPVQVTTTGGSAAGPYFYVNTAGSQSAPPPYDGGGGGSFGGGGGGGGGGLDDSQVDWGDGSSDGLDDGGLDTNMDDSQIDWGDGSQPSGGGLLDDGGGSSDDGGGLLDDTNLDAGNGGDAGDMMNNPYLIGAHVLGSTTVPKAVSYTDHDTVLAVQAALLQKGYDPGPLDGLFGKKTSAAIKKMQGDAGIFETGIVDYGVLSALKVTAPAYTPTTTTAGRSASAAAKDADAVAASATTPSEVQAASQQVEAANSVALPPPPPDVQEKVARASAAARAATTPAEVQSAALQVRDAAQAVASATSFWGSPLWKGAPIKRWQGAVAGGAAIAVGLGLTLLVRRR